MSSKLFLKMKHNWEQTTIYKIVQQAYETVTLNPFESYTLLGMSLEGRGLFIREQKCGSEIGSKTLNKLKSGQFIYSRLFAWKGAFDYVRNEFDGYYVSDEFPAFNVISEKADIKFIYYYFNQSKIWKDVEQYCIGVTKASRNRFKETFFLNFPISLPPLSEQKHIVSKIESIKTKLVKIKELRAEQIKYFNNLLYIKYTEIIKDAQWLPMKEIAPIIRREVKLNEENQYPELGIRCFGKGTFHKPSLSGVEIGTKKIFQIKEDDLVFSNVFAWEGGIAVAQKADNDRYGSHRFITCVANANKVLSQFLCFHFLSPKGMEDINACSPGGAGRNKTLGLDKLMKIKVPIPEITLQKEFVTLLKKVNSIKENYNQTDHELTQLMPSLLDMVFKGEL